MSELINRDTFRALCDEVDWRVSNLQTKDKNQRVLLGVRLFIENGIDTSARIVGAMTALGFGAPHVASVLRYSTGVDPRRHYWSCDEHGRYRNLDR